MPCFFWPEEDLASAGGVNRGDIDFLHGHHRIECTFGFGATGGESV